MKRKKQEEINLNAQSVNDQNLINKIDKNFLVICYAINLVTWVFLLLGIALNGFDIKQRIPYFVMFIIYSMGFLFQLLQLTNKKSFMYDNYEHPMRFIGTYFVGILIGFLCIWIPDTFLILLPIAVGLTLFATPQLGISAYIQILLYYTVMTGRDAVFVLCFLCIGIVGIMLFQNLDEEFSFQIPFLTSHLFTFVLLVVKDVLINHSIVWIHLLWIVIQIAISMAMLMIVLNIYLKKVVLSEKEQYQELNDPENNLLVELKESSLDAYYHAIHTAYFCEKLALIIGADARLAKAGGYYHKIGKMRGAENLKHTIEISKEYNFPPALTQVLLEYGNKNTIIQSKEAAIVLICDAMVSTITYLFSQNKQANLDYEQITELVLDRHTSNGILDGCDLSYREMNLIKKYFVEDTLYYDFLR